MNKKVKIALIIILILLILAVISGIIAWYVIKWEKEKELNTPEDVSNTYFELVNEGKYEKIYDLLTNESKEKISKEDFIKAYTSFFDEIRSEAIKTDEISLEKIDIYNTKVSYSNNIRSIYGEFKYNNSLNLKKLDNKKYYIEWTYDTIYPNFEVGDSLKIKCNDAKRGNLIDRNGILLARNRIYCISWFGPWMDECKY